MQRLPAARSEAVTQFAIEPSCSTFATFVRRLQHCLHRMCGRSSRGANPPAVLLHRPPPPWTHPSAAGPPPAACTGSHSTRCMGSCGPSWGGLPAHSPIANCCSCRCLQGVMLSPVILLVLAVLLPTAAPTAAFKVPYCGVKPLCLTNRSGVSQCRA